MTIHYMPSHGVFTLDSSPIDLLWTSVWVRFPPPERMFSACICGHCQYYQQITLIKQGGLDITHAIVHVPVDQWAVVYYQWIHGKFETDFENCLNVCSNTDVIWMLALKDYLDGCQILQIVGQFTLFVRLPLDDKTCCRPLIKWLDSK